MNLPLLRGGHPPLAIRPEDRAAYLDCLEKASTRGDDLPYRRFMLARLDATLTEYLAALGETLA